MPGDGAEPVEGALGPAQQLVALHVALVLDGDIGVVGRHRLPDCSAITEWSMTSSTGTRGLTCDAVAAEPGQGISHGGQVDHTGHAGEVLHEHPLGRQGDLVGGVAGGLAVGLGIRPPAGPVAAMSSAETWGLSSCRRRFSSSTLMAVGQPADVVGGEGRGVEVEDLVVAARRPKGPDPGTEAVGVGRGVRVEGHAIDLPRAAGRRCAHRP